MATSEFERPGGYTSELERPRSPSPHRALEGPPSGRCVRVGRDFEERGRHSVVDQARPVRDDVCHSSGTSFCSGDEVVAPYLANFSHCGTVVTLSIVMCCSPRQFYPLDRVRALLALRTCPPRGGTPGDRGARFIQEEWNYDVVARGEELLESLVAGNFENVAALPELEQFWLIRGCFRRQWRSFGF